LLLSEELVLRQYSKRVSKNLDVAAYTAAKHIMQDATFALQVFNKYVQRFALYRTAGLLGGNRYTFGGKHLNR
jgi:hypothetical protein